MIDTTIAAVLTPLTSPTVQSVRPMAAARHRINAALGVSLIAAATLAFSVPAQAHPVLFYFLLKGAGAFAGQSKLTDMLANRAYTNAPRHGTCPERREEIVKLLPNTLRLARYARDIYDHGVDLKAVGLKTKDLGGGRQAIYELQGDRYAEVRVDADRREVVVVFRGTRPTVGSDIATDALNFEGIQTGYYRWAASLVTQITRDHPGMKVTATGHSLGGGLVLYAVLRNPGVEGVVFNPAGLSWPTWLTSSHADRARTVAAVTVVTARNANHIDPITALSLAHRAVVPGRLLFVETPTNGRLPLHSQTALVQGLEHMGTTHAAGSACEALTEPLAH